ncbi:Serine/threonine-protein kinase [Wickerhamomyces ciferrii]|uniref:non-specific serine/threonine protein kinase n=1 Tax=Wickerhamomyces ciferrii (strain ATCC 14091 / BCRC 22168 / CBS 111 / JCM 3599 / NBRC 0793 / NRRL Y-1031 F-60-10) TaxID=1206466 RepID=K0KR91_WICCF|nr:Serine/threonine-protein kinase [Wickerhamomyces ciferrii]CCH43774.1 Serine/threonine-protein kinase [Wickerhamomyces ciferrii]
MSYHSRQPSVASSLLSSSTFNTSQINKIGPWKLGKTLGKGSTGRVLLAENLNTQQKAAVKVVSKSVLNYSENGDEKGRDAAGLAYGIEREIIIMKLLNHPNVLRLYDVWETSKSLYLILEYVEGGELFDLLVEKGPLSEQEALGYFRQIILGASYCHALGICHRDLKPENLLLDHNLNIKIADFGMAALENNDRLLETSCGSPHYAAPEIVSGKHYHGFESDVWSCGVILFALLTGRLPFDDENIRSLLLKVQNGVFEMPMDISIEAQDLISKMLTVEPNQRIKTHEILSHPLLLKYPLSEMDSKTLNELPSPNTYLSSINSIEEIDQQILENLIILWHGRSKQEIIKNLLKPESTTEKIFYFLLLRYRHNQSNNQSSLARSLSIAKSVNGGGNNRMSGFYSSSSSNKTPSPQNNSNRTPKKNRRSVISVSSSHRKSVSFNTKTNRRSLKDLNDLSNNNNNNQQQQSQQPPVPKNIMNDYTFSAPQQSVPIASGLGLQSNGSNIAPIAPIHSSGQGVMKKSQSKRRSMRTSLLPSKRSSVTSKLIAVYAKLANDNDWEYIDKEAKRTSSDFATLCDEIFEHEKHEKLRQERLKIERAKQLELARIREEEEAKLKAEEEAKRIEEEAKQRALAEAELNSRGGVVMDEDEFGNVNGGSKIDNNKLRSVSGPNERISQIIDKDEISKIQQRAISHPLTARPKSRLDPGLNINEKNWRTSKFYYDENDSVVQAIRRSKFLGSKFDLDLKRNGTLNKQKQIPKQFNDEQIDNQVDNNKRLSKIEKRESQVVDYNGPRTIADVKIPQVTRKSRHFSASNKRLSVLSMYSTKDSYTNLAAKLKELDEVPQTNNYQVKKSSPLIQQESPKKTAQSHSKSSGLRLSYADRLTALQESTEESTPILTNDSNDDKLNEVDDEEVTQHADDSMYKGLNIPDLPDELDPISTAIKPKKNKIPIHQDFNNPQHQQNDKPYRRQSQIESKTLPKPKRNAPTVPANASISTTQIHKDPLQDVTTSNNNNNNKRSGSGGFFRKWSLGKKDPIIIDGQEQPIPQSTNFFKKFTSNPTPIPGKTLNTVYEPMEMYQTLKRLLMGWNDYGLKNINAKDDLLVLEGEISKNNIMSMNSTKFKLNVENYGKKGSCIKFEKIKGSTKSFKTLVNEIERILNRENVLAFSN